MLINNNHLSLNYDDRSRSIDTIVIHYTEMESANSALKRLCDTQAKVSAHFLIGKDGEIFQLVPTEKRAWHAGVSHWRGKESINHNSIGIELDNQGNEPFPQEQMTSLIKLLHNLSQNHQIKYYLGHSDIAPLRKSDPGPHFNWKELAKQGFGHFVEIDWESKIQKKLSPPIINLEKLGYKKSYIQQDPHKVISAFKQHFIPQDETPNWNEACEEILNKLLKIIA